METDQIDYLCRIAVEAGEKNGARKVNGDLITSLPPTQ